MGLAFLSWSVEMALVFVASDVMMASPSLRGNRLDGRVRCELRVRNRRQRVAAGRRDQRQERRLGLGVRPSLPRVG